MKKYLLIFFVALSGDVLAQLKQFKVDERGKYIHYEVVEVSSNKDSLMRRAGHFLKNIHKKTVQVYPLPDTAVAAKGKFVIDKTILVASHPSGEATYNLTLEMRDGKYRFWLTDFEFVPYQRDRYGNFVPGTVKAIPLERSPGKLNTGEWKATVSAVLEKTVKFATDLKKALSENVPELVAKQPPVVLKEGW